MIPREPENDVPVILDGRFRRITPITTFEPMPAPSAGIFDNDCVCLRLNTEWASLIIERLSVLARPESWQGDATEQHRASQQIEELLLQMSDCNFISDLRFVDGHLEALINGVWVDKGAPITAASASTLPPGDPATAQITGSTLELGIPQGETGLNAPVPAYQWSGDVLEIDTDEDGIYDLLSPSLTGPQGIQGITGPQGPQGIAGPQGPQGEKGDPGYCDCDNIAYSYQVPPVTEIDRYCYAAQSIANDLTDFAQDFLEAFDAAYTLTEITAQGLAKTIDVVPLLGDLIESSVYVYYSLSQVVIDWLRTNVRDTQAISLVAEKLYCAMLSTHSTNFDDILGAIEYPLWLPAAAFTSDDAIKTISMMNGGTMLQAIYDAGVGIADGSVLGWFSLNLFYFWHKALTQVGVSDSESKIIASRANLASWFDSRDCSAYVCGWTHEFDFSGNDAQGWYSDHYHDNETPATLANGYWLGGNSVVPGGTVSVLGLRRDLSSTEITELSAEFSGSQEISICRFFVNGAYVASWENVPSGVQEKTWEGSVTGATYIHWWMDDGSPDVVLKTFKITVRGTGVNPFS